MLSCEVLGVFVIFIDFGLCIKLKTKMLREKLVLDKIKLSKLEEKIHNYMQNECMKWINECHKLVCPHIFMKQNKKPY